MDYEKKYKEALLVAKGIHQFSSDIAEIKRMEQIFPELKENNVDKWIEKIRKDIISYLNNRQVMTIAESSAAERWLAWLEKQGEKPQGKTALEAIHDEKVNNYIKVEPKFNVGDWIFASDDEGNRTIEKIIEFCGDKVRLVDTNGYYTFWPQHELNYYHLWTIKDAKDGDVLQLGGVTAIFQKYIGKGNCRCYCSVYNGELEIPSQDGAENSYGCINAIPATKEQRNLLFQKMEEAGYEWDEDKKELRKIKKQASKNKNE